MTTEEFAAMIVDTLDEQNYFKKGKKNHPSDMVISFVSTAETIATTMEWAIKKVQDINLAQKKGIMSNGDLYKNTSGSWSTASLGNANPSYGHVHAEDGSILPSLLKEGEPLITEEDSLGYSEWKRNGYL